ncbi:hypothetical protein ELQ35_07695 [Peribacillus cavernae]|uniref:DUF4363 family protein n=1 Tax=Peribacillus cavernae TaxID=1674310 RepID=A0A433HPG2_9BACI|nr:hypothetical protein [Peribacillus cavernae]MDQ0217325.1 hypothetical protein [Peribacillus cavernae]RUQ30216.1 hypothetical protein ELQ35_07695 [Peribacillus cavernae]
MNKYILPILIAGTFLGGCTPESDQSQPKGSAEDLETMQQTHAVDENGSENHADIVLGVNKVLAKIKELDTNKDDNTDAKSLNANGKQIEEEWDKIEKKVEKSFPEDYKNIEESLYPLIAELKKAEPDVAKVNEWSNQTKAKLDLFRMKAGQ